MLEKSVADGRELLGEMEMNFTGSDKMLTHGDYQVRATPHKIAGSKIVMMCLSADLSFITSYWSTGQLLYLHDVCQPTMYRALYLSSDNATVVIVYILCCVQ